MKIQKGELLNALKTITPYTGKTRVELTQSILVDGPGQKLMATNFDVYALVAIACLDPFKQVERPLIPADRMDREDLEDLLVDQLKAMAEYALTPEQLAELRKSKPKKEAIIDAIYTASETAADNADTAAASQPKTIKAGEKFIVNPKILAAMVKSLDVKDDVMIDLDITTFTFDQNGNCAPSILQVGGLFKTIPVGDPLNFPDMPTGDSLFDYGKEDEDMTLARAVKIDGNTMAKIAAVPVSSKDDKRTHVNVVYFDPKNGAIVGTDGSRMHVKKTAFTAGEHGFMLNAKAMAAAAKIAGGKDIEIFVNPNATWVKAEVPGAGLSIVARNDVDLQFPRYDEIIARAEEFGLKVSFSGEKLRTPVEQAVILASEKYRGIVMNFNGGLDVACCNPESGEYERTNIESDGHVDPPHTLALNGRYLLDAIKGMETVEIRMKETEEDENGQHKIDAPVFFTSPNVEGFTALVMPMRM